MDNNLIKDKNGTVIKAGDTLRITEPVPYVPLSYQDPFRDSGERYIRVELDIKTGELLVDGALLSDLSKDASYTLEVFAAADEGADDPLLLKF